MLLSFIAPIFSLLPILRGSTALPTAAARPPAPPQSQQQPLPLPLPLPQPMQRPPGRGPWNPPLPRTSTRRPRSPPRRAADGGRLDSEEYPDRVLRHRADGRDRGRGHGHHKEPVFRDESDGLSGVRRPHYYKQNMRTAESGAARQPGRSVVDKVPGPEMPDASDPKPARRRKPTNRPREYRP